MLTFFCMAVTRDIYMCVCVCEKERERRNIRSQDCIHKEWVRWIQFYLFVLMVAKSMRYLSSLTSLGKAKGDSNTRRDFPFESAGKYQILFTKQAVPYHHRCSTTRAGLLSHSSARKKWSYPCLPPQTLLLGLSLCFWLLFLCSLLHAIVLLQQLKIP